MQSLLGSGDADARAWLSLAVTRAARIFVEDDGVVI